MSNLPEYKGKPVLSFQPDLVSIIFQHPYHTPFSSEVRQAVTMFHVKDKQALPAQVIGIYSRVPHVIHELIQDLQEVGQEDSLEFWQRNLVSYVILLLQELTQTGSTGLRDRDRTSE